MAMLKGFVFKKTKPKVSSSDDSSQSPEKENKASKSGLKNVARKKFPHLSKYLTFLCNEPGCNFDSKSPEVFEAHLELHNATQMVQEVETQYVEPTLKTNNHEEGENCKFNESEDLLANYNESQDMHI